jgi:hypothetical protein
MYTLCSYLRKIIAATALMAILVLASTLAVLHPFDFQASAVTSENESSISIPSISTRYDQDFATFHIFGEVRNNLEQPVENLTLDVTFLDSSGNVSGTLSGYPYLRFLRQEEKSGFDIVARGDIAASVLNFSYYKISRSWDVVLEPKPDLLRLDVENLLIDSCDYYRIEGFVTNLGKDPTSDISISAAFYNKENQVVATALTVIGESLDATKRAPFALVMDKISLPHFAYYSLNVQSPDYSSVQKAEGSYSEDESDDADTFTSLLPSKDITVFTEHAVYGPETTEIAIAGRINFDGEFEWQPGSLVLIKVVTGSGLEPYRATAPVAQNGSFARLLYFPVDENAQGQVFKLRAEFAGSFAENTFSVGYASTGESLTGCKETEPVKVSQLSVSSGQSANPADLLSEKEIRLGSTAMLSTIAENKLSRQQNVVVIFEIFDERNVVVFLHVGNWTVEPNSDSKGEIPWTPQREGTFRIKSFAFSNLDQPVLLSSAAPLSVSVTAET